VIRQGRSAFVAFILPVLAGCVFGEGEESSYVTTLASLPDGDAIISAPELVEIASREYTLETYLWRDFMPISPPDGKPLIAKVKVTAVDLEPFPEGLDADKLYVIYGEEVWVTDFSDELPPPGVPDHQLDRIARDGPKWGPWVTVDVVVRLVGGGDTHLLSASDQMISRSD
jgi:hypothetical protein